MVQPLPTEYHPGPVHTPGRLDRCTAFWTNSVSKNGEAVDRSLFGNPIHYATVVPFVVAGPRRLDQGPLGSEESSRPTCT